MVIAYMERLAVIVDLETNVAASLLVDRMPGLQETTLPGRAKEASLAPAFVQAFAGIFAGEFAGASGIWVAVVAPL